jgi:hydroxyacylglutathione hydrolase
MHTNEVNQAPMNTEQYVCKVCGYNMLGKCPGHCPFCGADRRQFLSAEAATAQYEVVEEYITETLSRVNTQPAIGIEHAAYRLDTGQKVFLIDCPVVFHPNLRPVDVIAFTHPHFLGAANLYRQSFGAEIWIHSADAVNPLARSYPFDRTFEHGFTEGGLEAWTIGGHTPGFTVYVHADTVFLCDLVFMNGAGMRFNPYGPDRSTRDAGAYLRELIEGRKFTRVCGWNYVADYPEWRMQFEKLLETTGTV